MKTHTEIVGVALKEAYSLFSILIAEQKRVRKTTVKSIPAEAANVALEPKEVERIKSPDERIAELEERKRLEVEMRKAEWNALLDEIREPFVVKVKEKFQWADDRAVLAFRAITILDRRKMPDLRRVVVLKSDKENELAPPGTIKIDELYYRPEYFPSPEKPRRFDKGKPRNRKGFKPKKKREGFTPREAKPKRG